MSKYKTFKGVERAIAKRLGGERVGHLGGADVIVDSWLSIEVKSRKQIPQWIRDAIAQSKKNAKPDQLPILILHEHGQRYSGDLVVLALADFEDNFGGGGGGGAVGVVADAEYRAALGNAEAAKWLEIMKPDVK